MANSRGVFRLSLKAVWLRGMQRSKSSCRPKSAMGASVDLVSWLRSSTPPLVCRLHDELDEVEFGGPKEFAIS